MYLGGHRVFTKFSDANCIFHHGQSKNSPLNQVFTPSSQSSLSKSCDCECFDMVTWHMTCLQSGWFTIRTNIGPHLWICHSTQVTPSIYSQCHHHHHLHWGMLVSAQPLQTLESMEHRTSLQLTAVFTAVKITSRMIQAHRIGHGKVKELFQVFVFTYHTHDMGSSLQSPLYTIVVPLLKTTFELWGQEIHIEAGFKIEDNLPFSHIRYIQSECILYVMFDSKAGQN